MKRKHKLGLILTGLIGAAFIASGCTGNFCTNEDKSRILFAIESGVSTYYDDGTEAWAKAAEIGDRSYAEQVKTKTNELTNVWRVVALDSDYDYEMLNPSTGKYEKLTQLSSIIKTATQAGAYRPSKEYFAALDQKVLERAYELRGASLLEATAEDVRNTLTEYGYVKFIGENDIWENYDAINLEIETELGVEKSVSSGFVTSYRNTMNTAINNFRACITTVPGEYGNYGQFNQSVKLSSVSWGDAWHKGGAVIEGLIVYPVAWMVDQFAYMIAGGADAIPAAYQNGVPQLLALLIVTVIVRMFMFLVSFKSTMSQQKMQSLQPELAKIQQKYPNSNTNQAQKQRLAEEQMKLYKKHHINPLSQLIVLVVQFPIFIGVWGAMTGSAVLSTGAVLNLNLSTSIWNALINTSGLPGNDTGWWTALILIILMSAAQFFAMKIPQWISKARMKKVARLSKNPAQTQSNRTANIISYVMIGMIIVMGFTLPAAMGVYWLVGALISLAQSLIIQFFITGRKSKKQ